MGCGATGFLERLGPSLISSRSSVRRVPSSTFGCFRSPLSRPSIPPPPPLADLSSPLSFAGLGDDFLEGVNASLSLPTGEEERLSESDLGASSVSERLAASVSLGRACEASVESVLVSMASAAIRGEERVR